MGDVTIIFISSSVSDIGYGGGGICKGRVRVRGMGYDTIDIPKYSTQTSPTDYSSTSTTSAP